MTCLVVNAMLCTRPVPLLRFGFSFSPAAGTSDTNQTHTLPPTWLNTTVAVFCTKCTATPRQIHGAPPTLGSACCFQKLASIDGHAHKLAVSWY
eukprot:8203650-Lingulodinium_polyedra.AAC.1